MRPPVVRAALVRGQLALNPPPKGRQALRRALAAPQKGLPRPQRRGAAAAENRSGGRRREAIAVVVAPSAAAKARAADAQVPQVA